MQAEPVIMGNDRREVRKALRKVYGSAFMPNQFDFCIVGTLESIESVVIPDSVNVETCIDPDAGTVVRFCEAESGRCDYVSTGAGFGGVALTF